jgi:hypothetical protein
LYRIAAFWFALFAAGHTFGFLSFRPPTPEGLAVWDAMNRVHFTVGKTSFSYGGFYVGFGLSISLFMVFSAFLAWHLSALARRSPEAARALGWAFFALEVANIPLSLIYFSTAPAIFTALAAILLGWAAFTIPREAYT